MDSKDCKCIDYEFINIWIEGKQENKEANHVGTEFIQEIKGYPLCKV